MYTTLRKTFRAPRWAAVPLLLSVGCMLVPFDGMQVEDRAQPIDVLGATLTPGRPIAVQAWDPATGQFVTVANLDSAEYAAPKTFEDVELFPYTGRIEIPEEYWFPGRCTGFAARVRAVDDEHGYAMMSVREDWGDCLTQSGDSMAQWVRDCHADATPVATIVTSDYSIPDNNLVLLQDPIIDFGDCEPDTPVTVEFRFEPGQYTSVSVGAYAGPEGLDRIPIECGSIAADGVLRCELKLAEGSARTNTPEKAYRLRHEFRFGLSAIDVASCDAPVAVWTQEPYSGTARLDWPDACAPPTPPPPAEEKASWWDIECICATEYHATQVFVDGCMVTDAETPGIGAAFICSSVARELELLYGITTRCVLDAYENVGGSGCRPGDYTVTSVGP